MNLQLVVYKYNFALFCFQGDFGGFSFPFSWSVLVNF